jgi:hypothetical protein
MKNFTTYAFYTDNYLSGHEAVLQSASFDFYAMKATQQIKKYTFNNVDEDVIIIDEVQKCCCELAEFIYTDENKEHDPIIESEKVGSYSVSYVSGQAVEDIRKSKIKDIIYSWLADTGLLYGGR